MGAHVGDRREPAFEKALQDLRPRCDQVVVREDHVRIEVFDDVAEQREDRALAEPFDLVGFGEIVDGGGDLAAAERAYADRAWFLGDPDIVQVPVARLTSKKYAADWRATINPAQATPAADIHAGAGTGSGSGEPQLPGAQR